MSFSSRAILETWTYAKPFVIARGALKGAELLVVALREGEAIGRGEACPVPHYGQTPEGELALARHWLAALAREEDWETLHSQMAPGPARNAIDCAIWDLRAKKRGISVARLLGEPEIEPVQTVFTLGIDEPDAMGAAARDVAEKFRLIKVKLGSFPSDLGRIRAIRHNAPSTRLIVDVNEAWTLDNLIEALPVLKSCGVELIEQPLPANNDLGLAGIDRIVPIGADESVHTAADLDALVGRYDVINIKLDKSGGLTEAMRMIAKAERLGLGVMVGCMLASSLGIAPAMIVARHCQFVDLDAPLMLSADRADALRYTDDLVSSPAPSLWG